MSGAHCQVNRARVRAGSPDDGPRWRFVAEDALRTAEFGDAGRLLLVRRLRLTGLPARPAPGQAARALEAAWAAQARLAVPALAPGAADAPAVWFASRQAAQAAWLAAWADDDAPALAVWYWPAALERAVPPAPGAAAPAMAAAVWRAAEGAAPAAWRQALAGWPDRRLAVLAARWAEAGVLPAADVTFDGPMPAAETPPAAPRGAVRLAPRERAAVVQVAARLRALPDAQRLNEAARRWLALRWLAPAAVRPVAGPVAVRQVLAAAAAAPPLAAPAPSSSEAAAPRQRRPVEHRGPPEAAPPRPAPSPAGHGAALRARPLAVASGLPPAGARTATPPTPAHAPPAIRHPALERLAASRPWLAEGEATTHGGLLLLLNLLPRLRFPAWLETQPDAAAFVDALFLHLLDATGAPPDDPQRTWFGAAGPDPRHRAWRLRLRRALRRQARIDLGELVRRPALLQATPTHLDLVFPLEDVDLRLRRAGLDLDPGWVPWFGRIVSFHFL